MQLNDKKLIIFITFVIGLLLLYFGVYKKDYRISSKQKMNYPMIELKGNKIIEMKVGDVYQEPGYLASDQKDGNITDKVAVTNHIQDKPGTYEIIYTVENSVGNKMEAKRYVVLTERKTLTYQDSYDQIDNSPRNWWSNNKKDHQRPTGGWNLEELQQYNAYFLGKDEKVIYLTFDEGSNDTYLEQIVDILNKNDVKATFFFCRGYMRSNPELMKKLVETGHSVGNHTVNHETMSNYANKEKFQTYLDEIIQNEIAFKEITGVEMDKVYREPRGEWSLRSLQIVKDLGYKSFFWSADYYDFAEDVSKDKALSEWMKRYHNGAIYLIHPKNKGNYEAMDEFIRTMKNLGYQFDLVKNIGN